MITLQSILAIVAAFLIVTVSPGPANIAVASIAMDKGRLPAIRFGLGLSVGLAFWGVIAATGLGAIMQASELALTVLKLLGGVYLLWLAVQTGKSALRETMPQRRSADERRWFVGGLLLNICNPKAVVAWMAALSMGLDAEGDATVLFSALFICIALGFCNYLGHAVAFSTSGFMALFSRFRRWIEGAIAFLFAGAGFGLLRSALDR